LKERENRRGIVAIIKDAAKDFSQDECMPRAAALAYYTIFALPPLLVLLLMIAGTVWEPQEVQRALEGQFRGLVGRQGAEAIHTMIAQADQPGGEGAIRTILGVAGLLFGATGAFLALQDALNRAWEVKPDPKRGGIKTFLTKRLLSLGMVLAIGFLLAVSLALTAVVAALGGVIGGVPAPVIEVLTFLASFAVLGVLFAAMYKVLPDAEIDWRDAFVGGAATAFLFVLGKFVLGIYLGRSDKGSAFGAAGALAVVLLWTYYAGIIVLFGAEFTQKWAEGRGGGIRPEKGAVKVVDQERMIRPEEMQDDVTSEGGRRAPTHRGGGPEGEKRRKEDRGTRVASTSAGGSVGKGGMLLALSLLLLRMRGRRS
jgi:membrane protein